MFSQIKIKFDQADFSFHQSLITRVFPRRLTNGGFLTINYCLRIIGYCFRHCFLEIFVGDKALMEGDKADFLLEKI